MSEKKAPKESVPRKIQPVHSALLQWTGDHASLTDAHDTTIPFPDLKVRGQDARCDENSGDNADDQHRPLDTLVSRALDGVSTGRHGPLGVHTRSVRMSRTSMPPHTSPKATIAEVAFSAVHLLQRRHNLTPCTGETALLVVVQYLTRIEDGKGTKDLRLDLNGQSKVLFD